MKWLANRRAKIERRRRERRRNRPAKHAKHAKRRVRLDGCSLATALRVAPCFHLLLTRYSTARCSVLSLVAHSLQHCALLRASTRSRFAGRAVSPSSNPEHKRRKNRPAKRRVKMDGDFLSPKRTIEKRKVERINLRRPFIPTVKCYGGLYN
jgi:hypothetical protein